MKPYLCIPFLLFSLIQAEEPFIITNHVVNQEEVKKLTTTDHEFETLFEIVDLDETPSLGQNDLQEISIETPLLTVEEVAEEPLVVQEEMVVQENREESLAFASSPTIMKEPIPAIKINFSQVFSGSPIIYSLLLSLSISALFIGLYSQIHLHHLVSMPDTVTKTLRNRLTSNQYEDALALCTQSNSLFCKMLASGITVRKYGLQLMTETMRAEGKRSTVKFWQKLALLNDIAIIAPMLGLLGTVLGMFYAFYDVNRSLTSISALFDGLGISVGTTLAGLMVALLALMLHSFARYRLVKRLATIENEVHQFATLIDYKI